MVKSPTAPKLFFFVAKGRSLERCMFLSGIFQNVFFGKNPGDCHEFGGIWLTTNPFAFPLAEKLN